MMNAFKNNCGFIPLYMRVIQRARDCMIKKPRVTERLNSFIIYDKSDLDLFNPANHGGLQDM